jgi:outer membrane immunogenic protein
MKILLTACALLAGMVGAKAADMPPAAAPFAKVPAVIGYDWTGFYAGLNLGIAAGGEGRSGLDISAPVGSFETFNLASLGVVGGGQFGYNHQFGNWLVGAETDIQGVSEENHPNCIFNCNALNATSISQDISWFGTVRGRVGYAAGPILNYVTGGFAYGNVTNSDTERLAGLGTGTFVSNQVRTGFTIGSGLEAAIADNWTAKIEYLYLDLGSANTSFVIGGVPHVLGTEARESIFRAGLNYQTGAGKNFYSLAPAANWSGFYAGGNGGSGIARDATSQSIATGAGINNNFDLAPRGYNGGLQAGYNWQQGSIIYGLEADLQGSTQQTDRSCLATCTAASSALFRQKLEAFGTVRARAGYGVGPTLFYATGGLAYGEVKTRLTENIGAINGTPSFENARAGYSAGAGIETPLEISDFLTPGKWTVKTEYLYVDLGSSSNAYNLGGVAHTLTTEETNHIFRTGVNYRFGAPLDVKY